MENLSRYYCSFRLQLMNVATGIQKKMAHLQFIQYFGQQGHYIFAVEKYPRKPNIQIFELK